MHKDITRPAADQFEHVADLMHHFLSSISGNWIQNTMSIYKKDQTSLLEAKWQKEFYRIAVQKLASSTTIDPEVGQGEVNKTEFEIDGHIDFYIDGNRQWAVELLIRGDRKNTKQKTSEAEEQSNRFNTKYKNLPWKECLLVDFRPSTSNTVDYLEKSKGTERVLRKKFLPNYWIVIYDNVNYRSLDIVKYDSNGNLVTSNPEPVLLIKE